MGRNELSNRYYNNLSCKIFILGHATQGESAILLLCDENEIVYSCVIDSFVANDKIVAKELLYGLGVKQITELFWTHPHDDHSEGILDLIETFNPNSIYIASELHTLPNNIVNTSSEVLSTINKYRGYDRRFKNEPKVIGIGTNHIIHSETLQVGEKYVPFQVLTIAPPSGKIRKNVIDNNYNSLNDYSIVLSVTIGDYSILFTGDVQDRIISYANDDLAINVPVPNLLKIPHHGSSGSTHILDLFNSEDSVDIGVTTAKKSSLLPTDEALTLYQTKCKNIYKIDPASTEYATWGIEVNIIDGTVTNLVCESFISSD